VRHSGSVRPRHVADGSSPDSGEYALNDKDRIFQQIPRNREGLIAELQPAPTGENPATRLVEWTIVLPKG
jgi:hypothetical protein